MDSRIEELAHIIAERAGDAAENVRRAADGLIGDRYHSWRRLHSLARDMLSVIDQYRQDHHDEYVDIAQQQIKELHEQVVSLRGELRIYREREKTMGWAKE